MMDKFTSPTTNIQQDKQPISEKKKGKPAIKQLKEKAKRQQEKQQEAEIKERTTTDANNHRSRQR